MTLLFLILLYICSTLQVQTEAQSCPRTCNCEIASFSDLPINSVLVKSQKPAAHHKENDEHLHTYQQRNEVLDETDETMTDDKEPLEQRKLKSATCVLQPSHDHSLTLFLSLPSDLQVLVILHGRGTGNVTLDDSHFLHLQQLVVLEIHGFEHGQGVLRLHNNALKSLQDLRYLNLQHLHLLGDGASGNRPAPRSVAQFIESTIIPGALPMKSPEEEEENDISEVIQFIPQRGEGETDILPYKKFKEMQERAGLSIFAGLSNLLFLRAFHCNIKEVYWEMFEGLQQLEYLSLEGNKIPFLHEFAFYGTPNLKHLTVSHNQLLNIQLTGLAGLLKLEILDLSYNNISHLSELSLPPLPKLITADFHHNPIEMILPFTFQIMNHTEQLFLGEKNTQLKIYHSSFLGLSKLHKLSLNSVNLEVLEREYLKGMPRLKELKIEGTVHRLAFDAFAEVPKLQELILKRCSIREISMDAFFGLYGLMYLDLSHNELETLPPSLFDQQHYLKEINLHDNKLITLPAGLFLHTAAKLIRLDKNLWHCTCSLNEWQPSQINKIKVKVTDNSACQTRYDKGSMCKTRFMYQYTYDQSVSPRCATPARFSGWSVFHLLRKHLRCDKRVYKHEKHIQKENHKKGTAPLRHTAPNRTTLGNGHNSSSATAIPPMSDRVFRVYETVTVFKRSTPQVEKLSTQRKERGEPNGISATQPTITEAAHKPYGFQISESEPTAKVDIKENTWSKKEKEKLKIQQEKEGKTFKNLNSTMVVKNKKPTLPAFKINGDLSTKLKKKSDVQKKWELKMENTLRRLNKTSEYP